MKLINIVVVRFSVRLKPEVCASVYGSEKNRDKWLAYRFDLFNKTIKKSLQRQTVMPEKVYLLMDDSDRNFYESEIHLDPLFTPIFAKGNHLALVEKDLSEKYKKNIAVSRIDSDDLISDNYFEAVNASIIKACKSNFDLKCVIVCRGFRTNGKKIQDLYFNCSPFLTEYLPNFKQLRLLRMNHRKAIEEKFVLNNEARFMQFLHYNLANRFAYDNLTYEEYERRISGHLGGELAIGTKIIQLLPRKYPEFDLSGILKWSNVLGWVQLTLLNFVRLASKAHF
jgi:hypothetical protein